MIKNSLAAVGRAARDLFRRRGALAVLAALYFAALWCAYQFFSTGQATGWQLGVSAATALLAPLLFLFLQAGVAHYAAGAAAGAVARRSLADSWKVLLVSLPVAALGVGLWYLFDWVDGRLPAPGAPPPFVGPQGTRPPPFSWQHWAVSTLGLLAFGAALPLLAARLWIEVARSGLKATLKSAHRVAGRAFAPRAVLVYAIGALFFGVLPYFVVFTLTPVENGWVELVVFGLRLALAFALTLCGWAVTAAALADVSPSPARAAHPAEAPAHAPTEENTTGPRPEAPSAVEAPAALEAPAAAPSPE